MSSELNILVALDGEVDRGLIETLVARDPKLTVLDYLELGGPTVQRPRRRRRPDRRRRRLHGRGPGLRRHGAPPAPQPPDRPALPERTAAAIWARRSTTASTTSSRSRPTRPPASIRRCRASWRSRSRRRSCASAARAEPKAETVRNVICVLGLKGGSGKTLTVGQPRRIAGRGGPQRGHDGSRPAVRRRRPGDGADRRCARSMTWSAPAARSTPSKLEDFLVEHPSGARALLAPVRPDQAAMITVPFLAEVQRLLGEMFEFVVIDTPPSFAPEVISAVDSSTDVLVVAMRDTLSLKNTKLGLETLERMEYDRATGQDPAQPGQHQRRDRARGRAGDPRPRRRHPASRAIATSRARSTRASRSRRSAAPRRPRRSEPWPSSTSTRPARGGRQRGRRRSSSCRPRAAELRRQATRVSRSSAAPAGAPDAAPRAPLPGRGRAGAPGSLRRSRSRRSRTGSIWS